MDARRQTHIRGALDAGFVETGSQVFIPSRGIHEAIPLARSFLSVLWLRFQLTYLSKEFTFGLCWLTICLFNHIKNMRINVSFAPI